ncbi:uncharacterized protein FIESC28_05432 [Fusarium coffeatum]|uniref:Uncharacterized protein n=1 Tax=Fusarium coffeatum TaxID=231269 RepID=A0A366RST1_9HYPO|nr:uncharacterized protein FIESC28_05432 [Fusarium coffeatum]RBR20153.1 hypothetical protein FIESC28_05432 [Fusarium coffeatum]
MLRYPYNNSTIFTVLGLLDTFAAVKTAQPIITVFWSKEGELVGIGTRETEHATQKVCGNEKLFATSKDVKIPKKGWITEMAIITKAEVDEKDLTKVIRKVVGLRFSFFRGDPVQVGQIQGDVRVIRPDPGNFVVGFRIGLGIGQPIEKLALMFQPFKSPSTAGHLWKGEAPPDELDIMPCRHGAITSDLTKDDLQMETRIFGTKESDLDMISAIGVDAQVRGFELRRNDGTTRSIGKTYAMQGRQVIVEAGAGRNGVVFSEEQKHCRDALMGIYCHWGDRNSPGIDFQNVGAFTRKWSRIPVSTPTLAKDKEGRYWVPGPPPKDLREFGTIYGKRKVEQRQVPSDKATVSWFDCSRPISSIKVALCHGTESSQLPLVSLSFNYAEDQTTASIGPTEFTPPKDTLGLKGNYWCWFFQGSRRGEEELEQKPHYVQDEWNIEGARLKFAHVWIDKDGILTGLQFITEDGKESPAWGYCEGKKSDKLSLRTKNKDRAVGLKLFIDNNGRGTSHDDQVVTARERNRLHVC